MKYKLWKVMKYMIMCHSVYASDHKADQAIAHLRQIEINPLMKSHFNIYDQKISWTIEWFLALLNQYIFVKDNLSVFFIK